MTDPMPHSDELDAAARKERKKIETLTEARILRDQLVEMIGALQETVDDFDNNPQHEGKAIVLVVMPALLCHGFLSRAAQAARRMKGDSE